MKLKSNKKEIEVDLNSNDLSAIEDLVSEDIIQRVRKSAVEKFFSKHPDQLNKFVDRLSDRVVRKIPKGFLKE